VSVIDRLLAKAGDRPRPIAATIELTARCPLRCCHCYVHRDKPERLSVPVLTRLFDDLRELGGLFLSLTGGEVALRPDLDAVIAAARQRHFSVTLLSSGTLWHERDWDMLAALGVDAVRMSVYAAGSEVHDRVTGVPGSHARTLASARGLVERGVEVAFSCPMLSLNIEQVGDVATLATEIGVGLTLDPTITWTERGDPHPSVWRATPAALARVLGNPRLDALAPVAKATSSRSGSDAPCRAGRSMVFVDAAADVRPCANWPQASGNLERDTFARIWSSDAELERARRLTDADLAGCVGCELRRVCVPCPAMNLQEMGTFARPARAVCDRAWAARRAGRAPWFSSG